MLNRILANRYTILEHIGGGGMADVYRAHDELLNRSVAVKVLHAQFTNDDEFVTRFRHEAQAAARLSHHNIVNMYDVGRDGDTDYIVMEYISGQTLKEKIQHEGPLPAAQAVRIAIEIAEALEHAHHNNLIHCDIKPHNILVMPSGRIKVTDFGIARAVSSATMTHTGTIMGSVHYFSPEQAKGGAIGAKSDIYSLGVVLFEMLTGQLPFTGETSVSIALQHVQQEPQPPRQLNADISPLAEAVVLKAMAKEPENRFENSTQMIADLKKVQHYLRDQQERRLSQDEFPTQILSPLAVDDGVAERAQSERDVRSASKGKLKKWLAVMLALLLLGFSVGAFLAYGKFWSNQEIHVANVVGKQVQVAQKIITDQNLRANITETVNESIPVGQVVSQYPEAGSVVKEQRTITLFVSKGGEIVAMPDVRGLSQRDAEIQIKNAGLQLGRVDEQVNDVTAGTVISQNPRPAVQVNKNSFIDLVVSKGPGPRKLVMPDFKGSPISTIGSQLDSLKLKLGVVTEVADDNYPAGIIVGQSPVPEIEVTEGTAINFTVTKSAASSLKQATVQVSVPQGSSKQAVQIVVTDSDGRRVVYENVHKPGDQIEKAIQGTGQVRVQVYINGKLLQEQTI